MAIPDLNAFFRRKQYVFGCSFVPNYFTLSSINIKPEGFVTFCPLPCCECDYSNIYRKKVLNVDMTAGKETEVVFVLIVFSKTVVRESFKKHLKAFWETAFGSQGLLPLYLSRIFALCHCFWSLKKKEKSWRQWERTSILSSFLRQSSTKTLKIHLNKNNFQVRQK